MMAEDDWREYRRLVISNFETLERGLKEADRKLEKLALELAVLKVKSGVWGAIGGAAGGAGAGFAVAMTLMRFLSGH
jgi:hypothetical protein